MIKTIVKTVPEEKSVKEYTLEEIAEKLGTTVDKMKIKIWT